MTTQEEINKFSKKIEEFSSLNKLGILDSIVEYCEKFQIEVDVASKLLNQRLKQRLYSEAQELNLLPRTKSVTFEDS